MSMRLAARRASPRDLDWRWRWLSLSSLVTLGAAMVPAWRAASVNPTQALRLE